jgi:hypothetical protein
MDLLDHGLKRPRNNDSGEVFWPALETNVQQASDILSNTASVLAAGWGSDLGGGVYRQLITLPTLLTDDYTLLFDHIQIKCQDADGEVCFPKIVEVTTKTFYIYTNDNTAAFTLTYVV